jgi:hypothetical protein
MVIYCRRMEVTRHNFRSKLEEVEEAIDSCSFLSIDGEFTGGTKNNQKLGTGKQYGETRIRVGSSVIKFPDPQQRIVQLFFPKKMLLSSRK